jgi:hypothetical protein
MKPTKPDESTRPNHGETSELRAAEITTTVTNPDGSQTVVRKKV